MKKLDKKFVIISIIVALLVVGTITLSSYAYFSIANGTGEESVITSGNMALRLTDGAKITTGNMVPGEYIEKEFSVENTGNVASSYDIYLSEVINNFSDKTDFVYELSSLDGGYNTTSQVQLPSVSSKIVNHQSISVGDTHHYKLKITFLSKNENQDDNQGKVFSAKIQVNEYHDIETTVNYYLDNALVTNMPIKESSNYLNSSCDKNGTITFNTNTWTYTTNIVQNNTTCNIYFEEKTYTLTINTNGGEYNGNNPETMKYNQEIEIANPTKTCHTFNGWTITGNGYSINNKIFKMGSENTTLDANWTFNTVTITYNSNGGSSINSTSINCNGTLSSLPEPTRSGYTFDGWYTELEGGTKITTSTQFTSSQTIFAHWSSRTQFTIGNPELVSYYGNTVSNYTPTKGSNWRLFYADSNNVYLISDNVGSRTVGYDTGNISEVGENLAYTNTIWYATENGVKGAKWLLNDSLWTDYSDMLDNNNKQVANYAVGAPSLELFIKSFNATHNTTYSVTVDNNSNYRINDKYSISNMGSKTTLDDNIYFATNYNYWIAAQTQYNSPRNCLELSYSKNGGNGIGPKYAVSDQSHGIRPIASIPRNRLLVDGSGNLSIKLS